LIEIAQKKVHNDVDHAVFELNNIDTTTGKECVESFENQVFCTLDINLKQIDPFNSLIFCVFVTPFHGANGFVAASMGVRDIRRQSGRGVEYMHFHVARVIRKPAMIEDHTWPSGHPLSKRHKCAFNDLKGVELSLWQCRASHLQPVSYVSSDVKYDSPTESRKFAKQPLFTIRADVVVKITVIQQELFTKQRHAPCMCAIRRLRHAVGKQCDLYAVDCYKLSDFGSER